MTGSEPANTVVSVGDPDKSREEIERQQDELQKEVKLQSEDDTSSSTKTQKLDLLTTSNCESSPSPELKKDSITNEDSPSPELKKESEMNIEISEVVNIQPKTRPPPLTSRLNITNTNRMKRTASNCNVRNTSTLCSKESSYVYHCPARKRNLKIMQSLHPDMNCQSSGQDTAANQFHKMLLEDSISDETQSMVEMESQPFRVRGHHAGTSLRRVNGPTYPHQHTPQHGMSGKDHQLAPHMVTKQPSQMGVSLPQHTSHLALERVHSVIGGRVSEGQQARQRSVHPAPGQLHQSRPFTQQHPNLRLQQHPLNYKHGMSHMMGGTNAARPHPPNGHHPHALTRVMSVQVPRMKTSAHRPPESRVQLHVPSGKKMESLV